MKKSIIKYCSYLIISIFCIFPLQSQEYSDSIEWNILEDFEITKKKKGLSNLGGTEIGFKVNQTELFRAACCNLGESFTTNPSVDVSYNDAATGSKQIKLLGLSGNYIQLLTENLPNFRGAARPFSLRYVPGPWMKSISVSKGSSTVKNGYEAISGQIDVEYQKPQDEEGLIINGYVDSQLKVEANAVGNLHLTNKLNAEILGHYEDRFLKHDGNGDGFTDMPDIRQFNIQTRWNLFTDDYIMHAGIGVLNEKSEAGQLEHHDHMELYNPYLITMKTQRYEGYMKHAFILNKEHNANIAWMSNGSFHDLDAIYGIKGYDVKEWNGFSQLMFETDFNDKNNFSVGLSYNFDYLKQNLLLNSETGNPNNILERENTAGGYIQYTWKPVDKFTLMAGVRGDWSSLYKWFVTPRFNIKYSPIESLTLRGSIGKGYRTVFPWAEYNYLLASSRSLVVENLNQESSWNYGFNLDYQLFINSESIRFGVEYYYTDFKRQVIVDFETPHQVTIGNLDGKSFSHTVQIEATYESSFGLTATAAWRLNDVKTTYNGILLEKPLNSKYKGLLTVSYSTPMDIWQFDLTLQLNGGGRMPAPYLMENGEWSWSERFPTYPMLNFQATRWFRHFSVYAGVENITNYKQKNPIIGSSNPWGNDFDSTMVWGPIEGTMFYVGFRFNFGKL